MKWQPLPQVQLGELPVWGGDDDGAVVVGGDDGDEGDDDHDDGDDNGTLAGWERQRIEVATLLWCLSLGLDQVLNVYALYGFIWF